MAFPSLFQALLCLVSLFIICLKMANSQPLVPALFIFGDSSVDIGNNNQVSTIVKANFPPYGRDFHNHRATGRFSNGKLATDFVAENIGFTSYPPAFHGREARGRNLIVGANFASAASGYYDATSNLYHAIPLSRQLDNYRTYQGRLAGVVGTPNVSSIISNGIHLISAGNSDFLQYYYINPLVYEIYTPDQFSNLLLENLSTLVQGLYDLGARRIGVISLPPIGCLPAAITLFGFGTNKCVDRLNRDAMSFNRKLNTTTLRLTNKLSDLKLVIFDIYQPLYDIINNPSDHGFTEVRRGCCGSGLLEASILCNRHSTGTCTNASQYVFWDSVHPTEAANEIIAGNLFLDGAPLIG